VVALWRHRYRNVGQLPREPVTTMRSATGASNTKEAVMTQIEESAPLVIRLFEEPPEGWTAANNLGTEDISYDDCLSEEFLELEREAVFRRQWLMVGLESQLPHKGSYFTKELPFLNTSLIVARGTDGQIRAFHNMCSHRGNKLAWKDNPHDETCGTTRQFVCKYHGWRFGLDGQLTHIQLEELFFDLDKSKYGLSPVHCDTWNGFIFIHLQDSPNETLREQLGELGAGLEGYPFDKMTQVYTLQAETKANWKLWLDAFQESYHGTTLHVKFLDWRAEAPLNFGVGSHFQFHGKNALWSQALPFNVETLKATRPFRPMESLFESVLFGPWYTPDLGIKEMPKLANPANHPQWTSDVYYFTPNFHVLNWATNWAVAYTFWPLAVDRMIVEARAMFVPPENASQRLSQEMAAVELKEGILQDINTLEPTHTMLASRAKTTFPLGEEEVLLRFHRKVIHRLVDEYKAEVNNTNGASR
jgi:phenylpropionate dioxygenase-like ring-hydroxylating dioxygenase large terminal subunit